MVYVCGHKPTLSHDGCLESVASCDTHVFGEICITTAMASTDNYPQRFFHPFVRPWIRSYAVSRKGSQKNANGRKSKEEKKHSKKWERRECNSRTARTEREGRWNRAPEGNTEDALLGISFWPRWHRADTFLKIRLRRLAEDEPNHPDLVIWRWRWGVESPGVRITLLYTDFTKYEAACAGNIC